MSIAGYTLSWRGYCDIRCFIWNVLYTEGVGERGKDEGEEREKGEEEV